MGCQLSQPSHTHADYAGTFLWHGMDRRNSMRKMLGLYEPELNSWFEQVLPWVTRVIASVDLPRPDWGRCGLAIAN